MVRFAAKLDFDIRNTAPPDLQTGAAAGGIPPRLFDEVLKLFLAGCAVYTYELLVGAACSANCSRPVLSTETPARTTPTS